MPARRLGVLLHLLLGACGGGALSAPATQPSVAEETGAPHTSAPGGDDAPAPREAIAALREPFVDAQGTRFVSWDLGGTAAFRGLAVAEQRLYSVVTPVHGAQSELVEIFPDGRARTVLALRARNVQLALCGRTAEGVLLLCGEHTGDLHVGDVRVQVAVTPTTGVVLWVTPEGSVLRTHRAGHAVSSALPLPDGGVVVVSHPERADPNGGVDGLTVEFLDASGGVTLARTWSTRNIDVRAHVCPDGALVVAGATHSAGVIEGTNISEDRGAAGFVLRVEPSGVTRVHAPRGGHVRVHGIAQVGAELILVGRLRGRVRLGPQRLRSTDPDDDALVWILDATTLEHRVAVSVGGPRHDAFHAVLVTPDEHLRVFGHVSASAGPAVLALLPEGQHGPGLIEVQLARDGALQAARLLYPSPTHHDSVAWLFSVARWSAHTVLAGAASPRAPFFSERPHPPEAVQIPFVAIER